VAAESQGDALKVIATASRKVEAVYEAPYADHAPLEPMNCTVHVRPEKLEIWAPTQAQTIAVNAAAKISGYPKSRIEQ
jgi:isoquinoline 1-oxidoreductase beta subunit